MNAATMCATLLLTVAAGACAGARETAAPPRPAASVEDILGTALSVQPPLPPEPRWVWIDSAESRTLWLDTANIERIAADTFAIQTAFRFATPQAADGAALGRRFVEGRIRHQMECRDRRIRGLEFETRDPAGAVVKSGRIAGEWLRPLEGSSYANLVDLVCDFEGIARQSRPKPRQAPAVTPLMALYPASEYDIVPNDGADLNPDKR